MSNGLKLLNCFPVESIRKKEQNREEKEGRSLTTFFILEDVS